MFYKSKATLAVAAAITSFFSTSAFAQDAIETITVTSNKIEQSIENVLATVNVITRDDIDKANARDLPTLLQSLGGIDIVRNGGQGQNASLFIRGASSSHSLVLIDGIRVGSASLGYKSLSTVPLNSIERVEIVKGSRAAWYGSDALAGVINIITRTGDSSSVAFTSGADNYTDLQFSGALNGENYAVVLNAGAEKTDGFDVTTNQDLDRDGYENQNVGINARFQTADFGEFKFITQYSEGEVEYDSSGDDLQEFEKFHTLLGWTKSVGSFDHQLQLSQSKDKEFNTMQVPTAWHKPSNYQTNREEANYQLAVNVNSQWDLAGGIDWNHEDLSDSVNAWAGPDQPKSGFTDETRDNLGVYVGGYFDSQALNVNAVVRRDDNSDFGVNNTYNVAVGLPVSDIGMFRATHGTGFKAPTFNNASSIWGTNPDLQPEESANTELGFNLNLAQGQLDVAVFKNDIDNLIQWVQGPENVAKAVFEGVEISGQFSLFGFDNNANFTYLDAKDEHTGTQLVLRPKHAVNWTVSKQIDALYVAVEMQYRSDRLSYYQTPLQSYTLWNVSVNYNIVDNIKLNARLENAFDKDYVTNVAGTNWQTGEITSNYVGAGRRLYVGINYSF